MAGFLIVGLAIPRGLRRRRRSRSAWATCWSSWSTRSCTTGSTPTSSGSRRSTSARPCWSRWPGSGAGRPRPAYPLWVAALVVQLGSPLIVHPRNLFELRPEHFGERHSALLIVAIGESVAAVGIGAAVLAAGDRRAGGCWPARCSAWRWPPRCGGSSSAADDEERAAAGAERGAPRPAHRAGPERLVLRQHPAAARPGRHGDGRRSEAIAALGAQPGWPGTRGAGGGPGRRGGALPGRRRGHPAACWARAPGSGWPAAAAALATTAVGAVAGLDAQLRSCVVLRAPGRRAGGTRTARRDPAGAMRQDRGVIERYTLPEMGHVWSEAHKYELWCQDRDPGAGRARQGGHGAGGRGRRRCAAAPPPTPGGRRRAGGGDRPRRHRVPVRLGRTTPRPARRRPTCTSA